MDGSGYGQRDAEELVGRYVLARRDFSGVVAGAVGLIVGAEPQDSHDDGGLPLPRETSPAADGEWVLVVRWEESGLAHWLGREEVEVGLLVEPPAEKRDLDRYVFQWRGLRLMVGHTLHIPDDPYVGDEEGLAVGVTFSRARDCWCLVVGFPSGKALVSLPDLAEGRVRLVVE